MMTWDKKNFRLIIKLFINKMYTEFRLSTLYDHKLFHGYALTPCAVEINTTYRCNLSCKMCYLYGTSGINDTLSKDELKITELKKLFDELSTFYFYPIIHFTGGEPFIRKDMYEIIEYLDKKGLIWDIITNGTLMSDEIIETIVNSRNCIGMLFSIDGTKQVHDAIVGVPGAFEKTVTNIRKIICARGHRKFPRIGINCTISEYNYTYLLETVKLAESLKVDTIRISHQWYTDEKSVKSHENMTKRLYGIAYNSARSHLSHTTDNINTDILIKEFLKIKSYASSIKVEFYPNLKINEVSSYYDPEVPLRHKCIYPWFNAFIQPDGNMIPCGANFTEHLIGNLKHQSFKILWNSINFKKFRSDLKKYKYFPACKRCCSIFFPK